MRKLDCDRRKILRLTVFGATLAWALDPASSHPVERRAAPKRRLPTVVIDQSHRDRSRCDWSERRLRKRHCAIDRARFRPAACGHAALPNCPDSTRRQVHSVAGSGSRAPALGIRTCFCRSMQMRCRTRKCAGCQYSHCLLRRPIGKLPRSDKREQSRSRGHQSHSAAA